MSDLRKVHGRNFWPRGVRCKMWRERQFSDNDSYSNSDNDDNSDSDGFAY